MEWNPLAVCGEEDACALPPPRARSVDLLFGALFRWGTALYNTRGLTRWKRKWRAEQEVLYCAVERETPLRETAAALALIL